MSLGDGVWGGEAEGRGEALRGHAQVCERAESSESVLRDGANLIVLNEAVEGRRGEGGGPRFPAVAPGRLGRVSPLKSQATGMC